VKFRMADDEGAFDGLTAEEIRRIRSSDRMVTPGLEGLARVAAMRPKRSAPEAMPAPNRKRGHRA